MADEFVRKVVDTCDHHKWHHSRHENCSTCFKEKFRDKKYPKVATVELLKPGWSDRIINKIIND